MTLHHHNPQAALLNDITALNADNVFNVIGTREVDVMSGGPPCQSFSTAGAGRALEDKRGNLLLTYLDLAAQIRPHYLVLENVRGLLTAPADIDSQVQPHGAMKLVLRQLDDMGYSVSFNLYNAANFGAAQIRERLVIIAKKDSQNPLGFLSPTHSNKPEWGLAQWRTFGEVTESLSEVEHHFTQFSDARLKFFKNIPEGGNWKSLSIDEQKAAMKGAYGKPGGKTGFYRRLTMDKPSPTLVTSPIMPATDLAHPTELRPLSIEEYKAIQGFPQAYWIAGSLKEQYRQIGNAVPVPLGVAIGKTILMDMERGETPILENFPYSRYKQTSHLDYLQRK